MAQPDAEWKQKLTELEYAVLREKMTEPEYSGEYSNFYPKASEGYFACKGCLNPLYSVEAKFNSGCGWPTFDKCYTGSVKTTIDRSHGMQRIEIICFACGCHLGHVFKGEKLTDTNERHCVNSVSVKFIKGGTHKSAEEVLTKTMPVLLPADRRSTALLVAAAVEKKSRPAPKLERQAAITVGNLVFDSEFDSGGIAHAEQVISLPLHPPVNPTTSHSTHQPHHPPPTPPKPTKA